MSPSTPSPASPPTAPLAPDRAPRTPGPWAAALGLPLLVGILLAGRGGSWAGGAPPGASAGRPVVELPSWVGQVTESLPAPGGDAPTPQLPLWADELHRLLPAQPDPVLTPLAAHGCSFPALCAVAVGALLASALFLLLMARVAGLGEHARFGNALACALYLKVLVLGLTWGADTLTDLAPAEALALLGGPTAALFGCGLLAALLVVRANFGADLGRSFVLLGAAVVLPALVPVTLPFVFAPLVPSLWP